MAKLLLMMRALDLIWHRYWHQTLSTDSFRARELEHSDRIAEALDKSDSTALCAVVAEQLKEFMVFESKKKISSPPGKKEEEMSDDRSISGITSTFEQIAK